MDEWMDDLLWQLNTVCTLVVATSHVLMLKHSWRLYLFNKVITQGVM